MQELTDADKAQINRAIAERLGELRQYCAKPCPHNHLYLWPNECVNNKNGECPSVEPSHPDFFADAKAADRIKRWLVKNGFQYETSGSPIKGVDYYASIRVGGTCDYIVGIHSGVSEYEALALACVERGKFCPVCKAEVHKVTDVGYTWRCPICGGFTKSGEIVTLVDTDVLNYRVRKELEGK